MRIVASVDGPAKCWDLYTFHFIADGARAHGTNMRVPSIIIHWRTLVGRAIWALERCGTVECQKQPLAVWHGNLPRLAHLANAHNDNTQK